ncbi:MAG TPA: sigma-70 family RNA polymerase sigma factor [Gemmataceae bacterium]|nr:sigma-70 family RNA polymerase sigma factor [Gemmataceae bacterium]
MPDWQEILRQEGPTAWRTAYRLLGNRADADDCLQEAFLGALEVSRREDVQHWRALLQHLAAVRALDRLRARARGPRGQVADWNTVPDAAPPPSQGAEDAELAECLRAALGRLAPTQAEAFCLHCLEGRSYQEIARHLEVSVDAVGVHLHRARKHLRDLLAASLEVPHAPRAGMAGPSQENS